MSPIELLAAAGALLAALATGTIAHELSHAAVLRAGDVSCDLAWFPDGGGTLAAGVGGRIAAVTPRGPPDAIASWHLRVAAIAPLSLLAPLALIPAGVLPDPFTTGNLVVQLAVVGWLACALPSPQDFTFVWHPHRALASGPGSRTAE